MSDPSTIFTTNLTAWWRTDSSILLQLSDNSVSWDQKVGQWNDKTTNAYNLIGGTNAYPGYDEASNSMRIEYLGKGDNASDQYFTIPAALQTNLAACTIFLIVEDEAQWGPDSATAFPSHTFISLGLVSPGGSFPTGVKNVLASVNGQLTVDGSASTTTSPPSHSMDRCLIAISYSGSTGTLYLNNNSTTGTSFNTTGNASGGKFFAWDGATNQHGKFKIMEAGVLASHAATPTEMASLWTYAQAYWKCRAAGSELNRILILGDSRAMGYHARRTWARRLLDSLDNTRVFNYACPGYEASNQTSSTSSTAAMISQALAQAFPSSYSGKCLTVIQLGANDLSNHTGSRTTFETNLKALIHTASAYGPVVACTVDPFGSSITVANSSYVTDLQQFNADLLANWQTWGLSGVINTTQSNELYGAGTAADITYAYYDDLVHYNDAGSSVFARLALGAVVPLLNAPGALTYGFPTTTQIAAAILATPANLLATDATGKIAANNLPADYQQRNIAVTLPTSAPTGYGGASTTQIAAAILKTPANLLTTDGSGNVAANNLPGDYQQRNVAVTLPTSAPTGYGGASTTQIAAAILKTPANLLATDSSGAAEANIVEYVGAAVGSGGIPANLIQVAGQPTSAAAAVTFPATVGTSTLSLSQVTTAIASAVGTPQQAGSPVTLPSNPPAGYGGSSTSGTGPIALTQNTRNGVSDQDLCEIYNLEPEDLQSRFGKTLSKARAQRRAKLHELQTDAAEKLSATLLTHLGRHELGQNTKTVSDDEGRKYPEPILEPKVG
jgi:hypothetical protein